MAGGSTDTIGLTVRPGSFVVKRGSSILNKELLDSIIKQKPKEYASGGSVPIIATDGETLIPPEIVDMYGIDFFRAINNSSDNAAHSNIDALIGQAQLANMKPMYGGGEVVPGYKEGGKVDYVKDLALIAKEKREENPLFGLNMFTGVDPFDIYSVFAEKKRQEDLPMIDMESVLENIKALKEHHDRGGAYDTDTGTLLRGYRQGGGEVVPGYQDGDVVFKKHNLKKNRTGMGGSYGEPAFGDMSLIEYLGSGGLESLKEDYDIDSDINIDLSKAMIDKIAMEDDTYGGRFAQILSIPASEVGEGDGSRYYQGVGQYRGSLPDAGLQSSAIRDALRKMIVAPQDSIPKALLGYQAGGGVGEAGRKYPPGTLMSPFMGDKAPIPEAWMQPATDSIPSPEEVAEFDRMIEMLQAQELLKKKMKEMQALGMFSDKEAVEYKDEGVQFPVRQEGYPQR